jgi:hypothetical protein
MSREANVVDGARSAFAARGFCVVPCVDLVGGEPTWSQLRDLTVPGRCSYEFAQYGDVNEPARAAVARFLTDVPAPMRSTTAVAQKVVDLLSGDAIRGRLEALTGAQALHLRRCQAHVLDAGGFIGTHIDRDSNLDYVVSLVVTLGDDFDGGEFRIDAHDGEHTISLRPGSALIMATDRPHEVERVVGGRRRSLAGFYAATRWRDSTTLEMST